MSDISSDYHARPPPPPHSRAGRSRPMYVTYKPRPESSYKYGGQASESCVSSTPEGQRRRHSCLMCCAWTFLISFALAVVFLAGSFILVATLRSALPEVHVLSFEMPWLKIDNQSDTLLTAVFREQIEFYNTNSDTELHYTGLRIDVLSKDIPLGESSLPPFEQDNKNRSVVQAQTTVAHLVVNEDDVNELNADANNGKLIVTTVLSGYIGFRVGFLKLSNVPFVVVCRDITEVDVMVAKHPGKCEVQIFKLR